MSAVPSSWTRHTVLWSGALVLVVTLFPFVPEPAASRPFDLRWFPDRAPLEITLNVLLFVPLGFALAAYGSRRRRAAAFPVAVLVAFALSLAVELAQLVLPRHPGVTDITTNVAGAALGAAAWLAAGRVLLVRIAHAAARIRRRATVPVLVTAAVVWTGVWLGLSLPLRKAPSLDGWEEAYPLLVGDETTGERPWRGRVYRIWFADRALDVGEVAAMRAGERRPQEVLVDYDLRGDAPYADLCGLLPDLVALRETPPWLATVRPAAALTRRIVARGELTLGIELASAAADQIGPARIVSLSGDLYHRNLTVGQQDQNLVIRVRTDITGENGIKPAFLIPNLLRDGRRRDVVATWKHGTLRVYVDGARAPQTFELTRWSAMFEGVAAVEAGDLYGRTLGWFAITLAPLGALVAAACVAARASALVTPAVAMNAISIVPLGFEALAAANNERPAQPGNVIAGGVFVAFGLAVTLWYARRARPFRHEAGRR